MKTLALAAAAGAAVALAAAGASPAAVHGRPHVLQQIRLVERQLASPTADLGKHGFGPLDRQTITSDILDPNGKQVGRFDADCGITAGGKRAGAVCSGILTLSGGQLAIEDFFPLAGGPDQPQAIVGGTGAYEGARGEIRFTGPEKHGLTPFEVELVG